MHLVISMQTKVGQICLNFSNSFVISMKFSCHRVEDLLKQKYFTGGMPLLTTTINFSTCVLEALASNTFVRKYGVEVGMKGRTLRPE